MILYRILKPLSTGELPGMIVPGNRFKGHIAKALIANTAIAEVHGPPLVEIPGWKTRSKRLEKVDVYTAIEFLNIDNDVISELFNHRSKRTVKQWKAEVEDWLIVEIARARPVKRRMGT